MSLPSGVLFLSCPLDLTRAFYNLFLYNTQKERLKSNTRLEAGVRLATIILREGPQTAFLHRCPTVAVMVN